jgi:hypothetical protein
MTKRQINREQPRAQAPQAMQEGPARELPEPWQPIIAPSSARDAPRQQRLQRQMQDIDRAFPKSNKNKTTLPHPDLGMTSFC